jgi:hypothetical protein
MAVVMPSTSYAQARAPNAFQQHVVSAPPQEQASCGFAQTGPPIVDAAPITQMPLQQSSGVFHQPTGTDATPPDDDLPEQAQDSGSTTIDGSVYKYSLEWLGTWRGMWFVAVACGFVLVYRKYRDAIEAEDEEAVARFREDAKVYGSILTGTCAGAVLLAVLIGVLTDQPGRVYAATRKIDGLKDAADALGR